MKKKIVLTFLCLSVSALIRKQTCHHLHLVNLELPESKVLWKAHPPKGKKLFVFCVLLSEGWWDRGERKGESTRNFKIDPPFYKSQLWPLEFWSLIVSIQSCSFIFVCFIFSCKILFGVISLRKLIYLHHCNCHTNTSTNYTPTYLSPHCQGHRECPERWEGGAGASLGAWQAQLQRPRTAERRRRRKGGSIHTIKCN